MLRKIGCLFAGLLLAGCASTTRITDFSDRSVGYGWLAVERFKGGYLYWTTALPGGLHKHEQQKPVIAERIRRELAALR